MIVSLSLRARPGFIRTVYLGVIMELDRKNLNIYEFEDRAPIFEPEYIEFLRSQGYRIDEVRDAQAVESSGGQRLYVVCEVCTYEYPRGHPDLDVAVHRDAVGVCSCGDFTHRKGADVSVEGVTPFESGECKHLADIEFVEVAAGVAAEGD